MPGPNEFNSAADLIAKISLNIRVENLHMKTALHDAAELIQDAAQEKLGEYQPSSDLTGKGFVAWMPLAESTQDERERLGYTRDDPLFRSGELHDSIQVESHATKAFVGVKSAPSADGETDIGDIAVWMEGGTATAPPRPFLGPALYEHADKIAHEIAHQAFRAMRGAIRG